MGVIIYNLPTRTLKQTIYAVWRSLVISVDSCSTVIGSNPIAAKLLNIKGLFNLYLIIIKMLVTAAKLIGVGFVIGTVFGAFIIEMFSFCFMGFSSLLFNRFVFLWE